ncbi:MAG: rRNA maturation RNase YbeY [Candidatus Omnitrophica bacterium]|nr:rRNA maturation RNase YbeY [Candidatus Omnitrophota bacterium]
MKRPGYKINVMIKEGLAVGPKTLLVQAAQAALEIEGAPSGAAVNLLITDDKDITKLNSRFLGRNRPTDVIAFGSKGKGLLGEIAISADTARYNARQFKTTSDKEIFLYIIHGILHLLGYDDEGKKEKALMEKRQAFILGQVCRSNS